MKQSLDESVYAYKDRMLQEASVVRGKITTGFAKQFVKKTEKCANQSDAAERKRMENNAYDKFVATCYLSGCDRERYQSLIDDLRSQYSRDLDQYPETIEKAMTLLSKHRSDKRNMSYARCR